MTTEGLSKLTQPVIPGIDEDLKFDALLMRVNLAKGLDRAVRIPDSAYGN